MSKWEDLLIVGREPPNASFMDLIMVPWVCGESQNEKKVYLWRLALQD